MLQSRSSVSKALLIGASLLIIPFDFIAFNMFIYPMQHVLNTPLFKLPWIASSLLLSFLFFSGLFFQAATFKRAKSLLVVGLLVYSFAPLVLLLKVTFLKLIIMRLVQGLSFAMILPGSLRLLDFKKPSLLYYIWGALLLLGLFISPWLTAKLLKSAHLTSLLYVLSVYTALLALLNLVFLNLKNKSCHKLDPAGFLLMGSSMATVILSLSIVHYWGWGVSSLFFFLAFLLFNLALFAEKKSAYPLFQTELLKDRSFFSCFIPLLYIQFVLWPLLFFLPLYLQYFLGIPLYSMGLWLLIFTGSVCIGFVIASKAYQKGLIRFNLSLSIFLVTLSLFLLSFVNESGHRAYLMTILSFLGLGWGILFLNIYSGGIGLFPKKLVTRGFSFTEIFPFFAGAIGLSVGFNLFVKKFNAVFYDGLSTANLSFPFHINTHFFQILNLPDLYSKAIRECFSKAFLAGFHSLTIFLSWIGFACLIFSIVFIPKKTRDVLSED